MANISGPWLPLGCGWLAENAVLHTRNFVGISFFFVYLYVHHKDDIHVYIQYMYIHIYFSLHIYILIFTPATTYRYNHIQACFSGGMLVETFNIQVLSYNGDPFATRGGGGGKWCV